MGPIRFPNLGFQVMIGKSFSIFGLEIAYYGVIIAIGMIAGAAMAYAEARRTGQKVDDYVDFTIFGIIGGIIGARIYYVAFQWDYYSRHLSEIINIHEGGMAIYGSVIACVIIVVVFCKVKKIRIPQFMDTAVLGLIVGQIIGRWGNFCNREAFGGYTDGLFAMQIPYEDAMNVAGKESLKVVEYGVEYVQVHPTFLYESAGNLLILILLLIFRDKKKFYGETMCRYMVGYGILRFWVEGLRTDQLLIADTVAVSQIVSATIAAAGLAIIVVMHIRLRGKPAAIDPIPTKEERKRRAAEVKAEEKAKADAKKQKKEEE